MQNLKVIKCLSESFINFFFNQILKRSRLKKRVGTGNGSQAKHTVCERKWFPHYKCPGSQEVTESCAYERLFHNFCQLEFRKAIACFLFFFFQWRSHSNSLPVPLGTLTNCVDTTRTPR